jgi:hypothetical protein
MFDFSLQEDLQFSNKTAVTDLIGFEEWIDELENLHRIRFGTSTLIFDSNLGYYYLFSSGNY